MCLLILCPLTPESEEICLLSASLSGKEITYFHKWQCSCSFEYWYWIFEYFADSMKLWLSFITVHDTRRWHQNLRVVATELWKYNIQWLKKLHLFSNQEEYDYYLKFFKISIQNKYIHWTYTQKTGAPSTSAEKDVHSDYLCIISRSVSVGKQVAWLQLRRC